MNMCFKRLVLNIFRFSVALNENGKLLNLVETVWLRLPSGINKSLGKRLSDLQKDLRYIAETND